MVLLYQEVKQLEDQFMQHFSCIKLRRLDIDPETRAVNVTAYSVTLKTLGYIPVKMGYVWGAFNCSHCLLTSLHNAPHTVSISFNCEGNKLSSLEHGPRKVEGIYNCADNKLHDFRHAAAHVRMEFRGSNQALGSLKSLEGLPTSASLIRITYESELPLLRLIEHKRFIVEQSPNPVIQDILEKYQGQGKPGALKAAAELIKSGYKGNARW